MSFFLPLFAASQLMSSFRRDGQKAAPPATGLTAIPLDPPPLGRQFEGGLASGPTPLKGTSLKASPTLREVDPQLVSRSLQVLDAIRVALAINPRLAQAAQNVDFYSGRVAEARGALNPTLGLGPDGALIQHQWEPGYGIQATVPIDISNLLGTATRQAEYEQVGARLDVNRVRNEVVYQVEQAFFGALRAEALVKVASTNLQNSLDRFRDAQVRYKAQAVAYIDVLRAQTDVANAQKQSIQAQSDVNRSLASLANQMGIDVNSKFSISSAGSVASPPGVAGPTEAPVQPNVVSPDPSTLVPAPLPSSIRPEQVPESAAVAEGVLAQASVLGPEYQAVLAEALKTRPEIWESDAEISAAKTGILIAKRSLLPSFALTFGYYDMRSQTGTRYNEPQAFIGLNVPLLDGGVARGREEEAKAQVQEQETNRREAVDAVTLDVQNGYYTLVQTRAQVAVANQALAQAHAAFELARIRYNTGVSTRAGVSPLIEVSDAQVALTQAEENQVNALYDYNGARAQLDRAVGRFSFVANDVRGYRVLPDPKVVGVRASRP